MSCIRLSFESLPREALTLNQDFECNNDIIERIESLKQLEKKYICIDYLNETQGRIVINRECRARMVEWCYQTIDFFKLSRDTVHVAISCLDRFLSTQQGASYLLDARLYQLACIASLYIAVKVYEPVELHVSLLVQLCRGSYTAEQILETEQQVLTTLEWAVHPPSAKAFLQLFLALLPRSIGVETKRDILDLACYQIEMAVADYDLGVLLKPSATAVASLLNAFSFCPEVSPHSCSVYLRNLGKSTGCSRHMRGVSDAKDLMILHLNQESISGSKSCSKGERRESCIIREKTIHARLSGQHLLSPVAVMER